LWQPCGCGFDALREYGGREMMLLDSECMFSEKVSFVQLRFDTDQQGKKLRLLAVMIIQQRELANLQRTIDC
jgi:hypothetical protein